MLLPTASNTEASQVASRHLYVTSSHYQNAPTLLGQDAGGDSYDLFWELRTNFDEMAEVPLPCKTAANVLLALSGLLKK